MNRFDKKIVVISCFLAAITIAIGAFGAHIVKELVTAEALATFETGVRYQMYHVLALLGIGFVQTIPQKTKRWVCWFFGLGILFFSGSIYLLALKDVLSFSVSFLGPVTPLGGLLFMIGWLFLAFNLLTMKRG